MADVRAAPGIAITSSGFLFGSHAYLSAVAQTRPYGLKHGLDADS